MKKKIELYFIMEESIRRAGGLDRIVYRTDFGPGCYQEIRRGGTSNSNTFKWTKSTCAVAICLIKARLNHLRGGSQEEPIIKGGPGTLVQRIKTNYQSLEKLFGADVRGNPYFNRIIRVLNWHYSSSSIRVDPTYAPAAYIEIFLEGVKIDTCATLELLLQRLEVNFEPNKRHLSHLENFRRTKQLSPNKASERELPIAA